jgi:hypothetical protein
MTKTSKLVAGGVGLLSAAALIFGAGMPAAQAVSRSCSVNSAGQTQYVVQATSSFTNTSGGSMIHAFERTRDGATQTTGEFKYTGKQAGTHYERSSSSFTSANAIAQGRGGTSLGSQSVGCG